MSDEQEQQPEKFALRVLRNIGGTPFAFPTAHFVCEHDEVTPPILFPASQPIPDHFEQVGEDVPCDASGKPLVAEAPKPVPNAPPVSKPVVPAPVAPDPIPTAPADPGEAPGGSK